MRIASSLLAASLVLLCTLPTFADDKAERAKFNGKWMVTAMTFNGNTIPAQALKDVPWYWHTDDDKIISKRPGRGGGAIYEETIDLAINPSKDPKQLTLTDRTKKEVNQGIYKFDGDNLTICFQTKDAPRPTDFSAAKDSKRALLVLQKVK